MHFCHRFTDNIIEVIKMPLSDLLDSSMEAQQYFSTLPVFVKESITQSGIDFKTAEQLRQCAEQLIQKEKPY